MECESPKARPPGKNEKKAVCLYCGEVFHQKGRWSVYVESLGGEKIWFCSIACREDWREGREEPMTVGELIHEGSLLRQDDEIEEDLGFFHPDRVTL